MPNKDVPAVRGCDALFEAASPAPFEASVVRLLKMDEDDPARNPNPAPRFGWLARAPPLFPSGLLSPADVDGFCEGAKDGNNAVLSVCLHPLVGKIPPKSPPVGVEEPVLGGAENNEPDGDGLELFMYI